MHIVGYRIGQGHCVIVVAHGSEVLPRRVSALHLEHELLIPNPNKKY